MQQVDTYMRSIYRSYTEQIAGIDGKVMDEHLKMGHERRSKAYIMYSRGLNWNVTRPGFSIRLSPTLRYGLGTS